MLKSFKKEPKTTDYITRKIQSGNTVFGISEGHGKDWQTPLFLDSNPVWAHGCPLKTYSAPRDFVEHWILKRGSWLIVIWSFEDFWTFLMVFSDERVNNGASKIVYNQRSEINEHFKSYVFFPLPISIFCPLHDLHMIISW